MAHLVFLFNSQRIRFIFFLLVLSISLYGEAVNESEDLVQSAVSSEIEQEQEVIDMGPKFSPGYPSVYLPEEHLTNDWLGARSFLDCHGFNLTPYYYIDVMGNPIGGVKQGLAQASWLGADLFFDFEKMMGWCGWSLFNSWAFLFGTNLSVEDIGNDFWVQELFYIETVMLDSLYLKKTFPDIGLTFKLGRVHVGDDFATSPLYRYYVNIAFDANPVSFFYNTSFNSVPIALWGFYSEYQPYDFLVAKFGVFDANINDVLKDFDHGMNFTFKSRGGIIVISEWDYKIGTAPGSNIWPGSYKIGGFVQTGKDDPFTGELFGASIEPMNEVAWDYNLYVTMEQIIYHGHDSNLSLFALFAYGPPSKNLFPYYYSAGLIYQGFPLRKNDTMAFGFARGEYSKTLREIETEDGMELSHSETVLELNYRFQFTPFFYLTPDMQYVITPGGRRSIPNALVIGFEAGVVF